MRRVAGALAWLVLPLLLPARSAAVDLRPIEPLEQARARLIERSFVVHVKADGVWYSKVAPLPPAVERSTESFSLLLVDDAASAGRLAPRSYRVVLDGVEVENRPTFSPTGAVAFHHERLPMGVHRLVVEEAAAAGAKVRYDGELLVTGRGRLTVVLSDCAAANGCSWTLYERGRKPIRQPLQVSP